MTNKWPFGMITLHFLVDLYWMMSEINTWKTSQLFHLALNHMLHKMKTVDTQVMIIQLDLLNSVFTQKKFSTSSFPSTMCFNQFCLFFSNFNTCSYNKSQQDALFLEFILVRNSTCFRQIYQQTVNSTSMTNTYYFVYSVETPDDGQ
jgi:hypothetical protein